MYVTLFLVVNSGHQSLIKGQGSMRKKKPGINRRDKDTLEFIKAFMLKNGVTPTIREICDGLKIKSPSAAFIHLNNLKEAGLVIPYGESGARYVVKGIKMVETEE